MKGEAAYTNSFYLVCLQTNVGALDCRGGRGLAVF